MSEGRGADKALAGPAGCTKADGLAPAPGRDGGKGARSAWATAVTSLMHINCTTVVIVDAVCWGVLVPMIRAKPGPLGWPFYEKLFYSFISYNEHGANLVVLYAEVLLGCQPYQPLLLSLVGAWSTFYQLFTIGWYLAYRSWMYPFLDWSQPWSPVAYLGLYLLHCLAFGLVLPLLMAGRKGLAAALGRSPDQPLPPLGLLPPSKGRRRMR